MKSSTTRLFNYSLTTLIVIIAVFLGGCNSGGGSSASNVTPVNSGHLVLTPSSNSLNVSESSNLTLMLESSAGISSPITVTLTKSESGIVTLSESTCSLSTDNSSCSINVIGNTESNVTITASASGYTSVQSEFTVIFPYLSWTSQVGESGGVTGGYGISADNNGNSYVAGATTVGISGQTQTGNLDYFLAKYDESGVLIWSRQVGGSIGTTSGQGVHSDTAGNVYITGYTSRGISGQTQNGIRDYFVAKYNQDGTLVWSRQVGSSGGLTAGYGVITDTDNNIYITGSTNRGISGQTLNGVQDYFIAKYNESGTLIWSRQVGSSGGTTFGLGISIDTSGSPYITGYTNRGISGQTQNGNQDYFIAKYSESGTLIWSRQVGESSGTTFGYGVSSDAESNTYVTGYTTVGISGQTQTGTQDYFIAKYSDSGSLIWTRQVGAISGSTEASGISVNLSSNNLYIVGFTDVGISGQTQNGDQDYFVAKYNDSGNLIWTDQIGSSGGDTRGYAISTDLNDNTYISGPTTVGISGQIQNGDYDYFIAKYVP